VGYTDGDVITLQTYNIAATELGSDTAKLATAAPIVAAAAVAGVAKVDQITVGTVASYTGNTVVSDGTTDITIDHSTAPADAAAIIASIQGDANYAAMKFTVAASGSDIAVTWKDTGASPGTLTYTQSGGASSVSNTTAGVTAVAAVVADPDNATYLQIKSTDALDTLTKAIDQVAKYKAQWGAGQNRLEYTISNLMNVVEFTSAARSRIQDADFAVEAANLAKAQVLQQTGTAMLAQANAAPQLALQLLK
jgi:flagellin